jgi:Thioesterase superfamily
MTKNSPFPPTRTLPDGVSLCRGCTPSDACRLGLTHLAIQPEPKTVTSTALCPSDWEGGPMVAHGGWIACVFDEVLGMLPARLHVPCVTAALQVEYLKPVPIQRRVVVFGQVESHTERRWTVTGTLRLADGDADLARATAHLVEPRADHFDKVCR